MSELNQILGKMFAGVKGAGDSIGKGGASVGEVLRSFPWKQRPDPQTENRTTAQPPPLPQEHPIHGYARSVMQQAASTQTANKGFMATLIGNVGGLFGKQQKPQAQAEVKHEAPFKDFMQKFPGLISPQTRGKSAARENDLQEPATRLGKIWGALPERVRENLVPGLIGAGVGGAVEWARAGGFATQGAKTFFGPAAQTAAGLEVAQRGRALQQAQDTQATRRFAAAAENFAGIAWQGPKTALENLWNVGKGLANLGAGALGVLLDPVGAVKNWINAGAIARRPDQSLFAHNLRDLSRLAPGQRFFPPLSDQNFWANRRRRGIINRG